MSTITKDLGVVTAYGYAVSKGYTGTEEEFAELMASYATVAESAAQSATTATEKAEQAAQAVLDAVAAKEAAQAAQSAAQSAKTSAESAASSASTSATNAASSASTASTAASTASTKASEAAASATSASGSATTAQAAQTAAETAQSKAEDAQEAAEQAAEELSAEVAQIETNKNDIANLKSDLNNVVSKNGFAEVTPQNLQIMDVVISPNLIDESAITNGTYITADGAEHNGNYFVTDYIPVEAGEQYCGKWLYTNSPTGDTILYDLAIRWLTCYDADKNVMASSGSNTAISTYPYTIPEGVSFVRLSVNNNASYSKYQFEKGATATSYEPYGPVSATIKEEYLPQEEPEPIEVSDLPPFELVRGQNLFDISKASIGYYVAKNGTAYENQAYLASDYIEVSSGDTLLGSYLNNYGNTAPATIRFVACYDSNKVIMPNDGVNNLSNPRFTVPNGVSFVRLSFNKNSYGTNIQVEISDDSAPKPYAEYEEPQYKLIPSYLPDSTSAPKYAYLPKDIYVAVGRTIEIYNEQVVLNHERYHFQWISPVGYATKRKLSITGSTVGNYAAQLYLWDDDKKSVWAGATTIHVVAASNPTKKILPIGDSLTNWKAWLQETMLLSSNHITWVGTRYSGLSVDSEGNNYASGTIHHEGRSGWAADTYLADSTYDFDNRYDGVSSVSGTANPFWDGTKFSLSHYFTTQTGVDTPDAVQIFLGTNDLNSGVDTAVSNIASMVNSIRSEYENMPIFVCNTIYNSNQNGYGRVGNDAYSGSTSARVWQYDQDSKVMDLMRGLEEALESVSGVYFIPIATCMDREYNFGQVATKVNPRSDITEMMPVERIHPQVSGYYQMADLMYSTYCGVLS